MVEHVFQMDGSVVMLVAQEEEGCLVPDATSKLPYLGCFSISALRHFPAVLVPADHRRLRRVSLRWLVPDAFPQTDK